MINISASEFEQLCADCGKRTVDIDEIVTQVGRAVANKNIESDAGTAIEALWKHHRQELEELKSYLEAWGQYHSSQIPIAEFLNGAPAGSL